MRFDGDCVDHFLQLSHLYHLQDSWWCLVIHHSHQHLGVFDAGGKGCFFSGGSTGKGFLESDFFWGGRDKQVFGRGFLEAISCRERWSKILGKSLGGWWSQGGIRWIFFVAGTRMTGRGIEWNGTEIDSDFDGWVEDFLLSLVFQKEHLKTKKSKLSKIVSEMRFLILSLKWKYARFTSCSNCEWLQQPRMIGVIW